MRTSVALGMLLLLFSTSAFAATPNPPVLQCNDGSSCGGAPYDLTAGGTRIPPSWVTDGTFQWPEPPVTTRTINVPVDMSLSSAVALSGARIVVGSGHTHNGNITVSANDVDIVMPNTARINGSVSFGIRPSTRIARVRITGGNITGGPVEMENATDVLLDNIVIVTDGTSNIFNGGANRGRRFAVINSTMDLINVGLGTGWNIYTDGTSPGDTNKVTDLIIANVKFGSTSGQVIRLQHIENLVIADSYISYTGNELNGLRIHKETNNVWLVDTLSTKGIAMDANAGSGAGWAYAVNNATFDGWQVYGTGNALTVHDDQINSMIRNSTSHNTNTDTGTPYVGGFLNGGGNVGVPWNGSTRPDSSGYGADH